MKLARVVRTALRRGRPLLELVAEKPLDFVGGQFVTVDTGLVHPSGKPVRRAYSVLSSDAEQLRFELASKRIPDGPVLRLRPRPRGRTRELRFTGPWGKFFPARCAAGKTLVLATDTGVTAALGLVQSRGLRAAAESKRPSSGCGHRPAIFCRMRW